MPFVEGKSLRALLNRAGELPLAVLSRDGKDAIIS
jgi:hypothetical protein